MLALGSVDLNDRDKFHSDKDGISANTVLPGAPVIPDQLVPYPQAVDDVPENVYPGLPRRPPLRSMTPTRRR